jgi:secreted trypsin-like serine protease
MSTQRIRQRPLATLTGALLLATLLWAPASGADERPIAADIIGGGTVDSAPWAAAVYHGDRFFCSGTIIAPRWVLTASHCVGDDMTVRIGSVYRDHGGTVANVVDAMVSPHGDLSLLELGESVSTTYSPLSSSYPAVGATNYIYGWGRTSYSGEPSLQLKTAAVEVTSTNCRDYVGGRGICSHGLSGVAWGGDSGGPQFQRGRQVGVSSTADGSTSQTYGAVAASRSWIRSVSGA